MPAAAVHGGTGSSSMQSWPPSAEVEILDDLHTFASHCAGGKTPILSDVASFCEEISLSEYFLFGPTLKCKIESLPLNNTLCCRLTTFSFSNMLFFFTISGGSKIKPSFCEAI